MKQNLVILLLCCLILSCKKKEVTPIFIITDINGSEHSLRVNPYDGTVAGSSSVIYIPPSGVGPLPGYFWIHLFLSGGNGVNTIYLNLPNLNINNTTYDSSSYYTQGNPIIDIDGVYYFANNIHINNVSISLTSHIWVGQPMMNSISSGSLDLSLNAVSSQNINGNITRLNDLHKKIYIKGSFKNIYANM